MNVQIALLGLALTAAKVPYLAHAQNASEHPNWPSAGQLFLGTCYQPIDRSPQQIDQDIAIMKHAGLHVDFTNRRFSAGRALLLIRNCNRAGE